MIYIAGPYRAENSWEVENNIRVAEEAAMFLATKKLNFICPHTMCRFFDGTVDDDYWIGMTEELLKRCDSILMLPGWEDSIGSVSEYNYAKKNNYPVGYYHEIAGATGQNDLLRDRSGNALR